MNGDFKLKKRWNILIKKGLRNKLKLMIKWNVKTILKNLQIERQGKRLTSDPKEFEIRFAKFFGVKRRRNKWFMPIQRGLVAINQLWCIIGSLEQ